MGYALWIIQSSWKYNISELFFLSRDGNQILKVYKKIGDCLPKNIPIAKYLYASRRAMLIPYIDYSGLNSEELRFLISSWWENLKVRDFLFRLKIDISEKEAQKVCFKAGFPSLDYRVKKKDYKKLEKMFILISKSIKKRSVKERILLREYLEQEKFFESVNPGIVDIGWGGSMQKSLYSLLRENGRERLSGFYFGINNRIKSVRELGMLAEGFFLREIKDESLVLYAIWQSTEILEFMFSAQHPTVVFFEKKKSGIEPFFSMFNNDAEYLFNAKILQSKAMDFVDDFLRDIPPMELIDYIENANINSMDYVGNLLNLTLRPTVLDVLQFSKIRHVPGLGETNEGKHIVNGTKSLRPLELKSLFENSYWENGFLVRLSKLQRVLLFLFCAKYRDRINLKRNLLKVLKHLY